MAGFLSSCKKEASLIGKEVKRGAEDIGRTAKHAVDVVRSNEFLDMFKTGSVVQLISRSSGRTLQIVRAPTGQLVIDGQGPQGNDCYYAHWVIFNEGLNIIKLYNQNNYLAVINGATVVVPVASPDKAGIETSFRLSQSGQFASLESKKEPGRHVGVLPTGELKTALACGKENDGQFGVIQVFNPQDGGKYAGASAEPPAYPEGATVTVTNPTQ